MDVNNDNNAGNDASSTTSNKGNNVAIAMTAKMPAHWQQRLHIGNNACTLATTPAHWQRQQITPWTRQWGGGDSGLKELLVFRSYMCLE
jgi:hypothetical protein